MNEAPGSTSQTGRSPLPPPPAKDRGSFPLNLWDMMTHEPPHSSCGWTGDGMAFCLSDPAKFAAEVLPQYFRHQKLSSFVRQLHYYGFEAMEKGMLADEGGGGGAGTNAPRTYVHIGGVFHRD